jgi:hypothetical protein
MKQGASIFVECRGGAYTPEERDQLHQDLCEQAPTRVKEIALTAAGGASEIWVIIEFVGEAFLHVTLELLLLKAILALSHLFEKRKKTGSTIPEMSLKVNFDDTSIVICPVSEELLANLPTLLANLKKHLGESPLQGQDISQVVFGIYKDGERWHKPTFWDELGPDGGQYWGLSVGPFSGITHIYDTKTGLLTEIP